MRGDFGLLLDLDVRPGFGALRRLRLLGFLWWLGLPLATLRSGWLHHLLGGISGLVRLRVFALVVVRQLRDVVVGGLRLGVFAFDVRQFRGVVGGLRFLGLCEGIVLGRFPGLRIRLRILDVGIGHRVQLAHLVPPVQFSPGFHDMSSALRELDRVGRAVGVRPAGRR
ncbi:hypothetical protein [Streptomyces sp. NPDC088762]|uniref:hypothetical protein n=1 Tax=Streptomyces sp. NPDC088762 TaxID=3365891 RepID=UPI003804CF83